MHARVMRIIASVDSWIAASGMFSIVTSCALCMTVARMVLPFRFQLRAEASWPVARYCLVGMLDGEILFVRHMLQPRDRGAVQRLLDGDVRHRGSVGRAMPVFVVRRTPNDVAGADFDPLLTFALGPAGAGNDDERLPKRMRVPGGSCTRLEADAGDPDARRLGRIAQRLDGDFAREPFGRALLRRPRTGALEFHAVAPFRSEIPGEK